MTRSNSSPETNGEPTFLGDMAFLLGKLTLPFRLLLVMLSPLMQVATFVLVLLIYLKLKG